MRVQPPPHAVAASTTHGCSRRHVRFCRQCAELVAAVEQAGAYQGALDMIEAAQREVAAREDKRCSG